MKISHILPELLAESSIWRNVFETADIVVGGPIETRIAKIRDRRSFETLLTNQTDVIRAIDIGDDTDTQTKIAALAFLLGLTNLIEDGFSSEIYTRFVEEAARFIQDKSTKKFINFFSYVFNASIEVVYLWYDPVAAEFYAEVDAEIQGRRLGVDGFDSFNYPVYPTPYVNLLIEPSFLTSNTAAKILELFYSICPLDHVVRDVIIRITSPVLLMYFKTASETELLETKVGNTIYLMPSLPEDICSPPVSISMKYSAESKGTLAVPDSDQ